MPGTNPFFPLRHEQQGNRFLELLGGCGFEVFLLNTGRVGGADGDPQSKKVSIPHSSAIVKAIAEAAISWERDPDFGVRGRHLRARGGGRRDLQPRHLYRRQGRQDEYARLVARLSQERRDYLGRWEGLRPEIVAAAGG